VVLSLVAAVGAALCYGIASVMQAVAVRAASRRPATGGPAGSVDPGLVVRMLRQWRFVASLGLDLIGFLAQLVALRRLPLFAVQAMVAGSLAVTAVLAAWLINVQLAWREWLAVAGVVVGVGLLGASAGAEGAKAVGGPFKLALIVAVAAVAVAGVLAARLPRPARTPVLGAVAGLGYGVVAVAARILPGYSPAELARDPAAYAAVAGGVVSFMLYAAALDNGSVTVATAAVVLAETAPPALIGILFLGDHTRPGLVPVAWAAFVLAVTSAVLLARFGEAGENAGGGPQTAGQGPRGGLSPDQDGEPSTSTVL
jgi:drug/metabolite transporter (DMT)-like permease